MPYFRDTARSGSFFFDRGGCKGWLFWQEFHDQTVSLYEDVFIFTFSITNEPLHYNRVSFHLIFSIFINIVRLK